MAARSLQAWSRTVTIMKIGKLNSRTLRRRSYTITYNKLKLSPMTDHDRGAAKRSFKRVIKPCTRKAVNSDQSKEIIEEASNRI